MKLADAILLLIKYVININGCVMQTRDGRLTHNETPRAALQPRQEPESRMSKSNTVTRDSIRTANGRIVSRDSSSGQFSSVREAQRRPTHVDAKRVSEVGSRSMPVPSSPKKK